MTMKKRELHGGRDTASSVSVSNDGKENLEASESPSKDSTKQLIPGWSWDQLMCVLVIFRTVNALFNYTAFVPDEYWQSLEVAHRMVFGYPLIIGSIAVYNLYHNTLISTCICT